MVWTIEQHRACNRKSYHKNKEKRLAYTRTYHRKLKQEVFSHYSKGKPICECCGEDTVEFLSLDHIEGNGSQYRKNVGTSYSVYLWLRKNNYPKGYRILCHNCNQATSWGRTCPHELLENK